MSAAAIAPASAPPDRSGWTRFRRTLRRYPTLILGSAILAAVIGMALFAPLIAPYDPNSLSPLRRLRPPSGANWLGTDMLGRDVFSRVVYGARVSLIVGLAVAFFSAVIGMVLGLLAGTNRVLGALIMLAMDGLMAIPAILLAIALMALNKASIGNIILAISISEVPRVCRLMRGVVLSVREQPFIEAAEAVGTGYVRTLWRHILPNTLMPLIVQCTFIFASAMILEAILSFLGAGTPPSIPSWGGIMADGRAMFELAPQLVLAPGLFLSMAVLGANFLGDGLRDMLDPRLVKTM